jgi:hypothetical protein
LTHPQIRLQKLPLKKMLASADFEKVLSPRIEEFSSIQLLAKEQFDALMRSHESFFGTQLPGRLLSASFLLGSLYISGSC